MLNVLNSTDWVKLWNFEISQHVSSNGVEVEKETIAYGRKLQLSLSVLDVFNKTPLAFNKTFYKILHATLKR